ncbi:hypothetical protein HKX48_001046 [Thoreauomyces humboldtii]|nr:hypothetical protein HKX48_001046 [Thoreauomyces humboldtii]
MSSTTTTTTRPALTSTLRDPTSWRSVITPANKLLLTGIIHCLVPLGVPALRDPLLSLLRTGYVDGLRALAHAPTPVLYAQSNGFWFVVSGVLMGIAGRALQCYVRDVGEATHGVVKIPRSVAWGLLGLGVVGVTSNPVSGFWSLLLQGVWMLNWESRPVTATKRGKAA